MPVAELTRWWLLSVAALIGIFLLPAITILFIHPKNEAQSAVVTPPVTRRVSIFQRPKRSHIVVAVVLMLIGLIPGILFLALLTALGI